LHDDNKRPSPRRDYDVLRISGDGRCLFRCVAVAGSQELQLARRSVLGCPANKQFAAIEEQLANNTRNSVANLLRANRRVLEEMSHDLEFILDDEIGKKFLSITDRIENVAEVNAYVGYLEILCVA